MMFYKALESRLTQQDPDLRTCPGKQLPEPLPFVPLALLPTHLIRRDELLFYRIKILAEPARCLRRDLFRDPLVS